MCLRCGIPGHGARDCKWPRSPSSEQDLRHASIAKIAQRPRSPFPHPRQTAPPPPTPPAPRAAILWPSILAPRLQAPVAPSAPVEDLSILRRSRSIEELERRLHHAMVVYTGGALQDWSPNFILDALEVVQDVEREGLSIHAYRLENFVVVFARAESRNRVSSQPAVDFNGVKLFFRSWNRQAQACHAIMRFKVFLEIEGIPPHAWERETVEELLGSSCIIDVLAYETSSRRDLFSFKLAAWTSNPDDIPAVRLLGVPDTVWSPPMIEPTLLQ